MRNFEEIRTEVGNNPLAKKINMPTPKVNAFFRVK